MYRRHRNLGRGLSLCFGLLTVALPARAADLYVPGTYPSIQAAINVAQVGDRILVASGTYTELLSTSGDTITLEAANPDAPPVIQPPGSGVSPYSNEVLLINGGHVTLRRVVIDGNQQRRGIQAFAGANVVLDGVTVRNGANPDGYPGAGMDLWGGAVAMVTGSTFEGNSALGYPMPYGGHIGIETGASIDFGDGTMLIGGTAGRGGGIWVQSGGTADVWSVTFDGNTATGYGDNDGGGLCAEALSNVSVAGSSFSNNGAGWDADSAGGGIYSAARALVVTESSFMANGAHLGGGIAVDDEALISVANGFYGNSADKGAGVGCVFATVCLSASSEYTGNSAEEYGGAVFAWNSNSLLDNDRYCMNQIDPFGTYGLDGGAVRQSEGVLEIRNTVFASNTAVGDGGAVSMSDGILDSRNNHYLDNSAGGVGGGVHATDTFGLGSQADSTNDLFGWNAAAADGGIHFGGGLTNLVRFGWFWQNAPDSGTIGLLPSNSDDVGDPLLAGYQTGSCGWDSMIPEGGSPLIDAGDPLLFDLVNGSRSDIGAFGGGEGNLGDADGDGIPFVVDCDDGDPALGLPDRWFPDADGDGWGDTWLGQVGCTPPVPGWIAQGGDCDDGDPSINPSNVWFYDGDGDGFGDSYWWVNTCNPPWDFVDNGLDCDDYDPGVGRPYILFVDNDRDGFGIDEGFESCDAGSGAPVPGDCDDAREDVHPGAEEVCDEVDQDCNGVVDDGPVDPAAGWKDGDGDGFGDPDSPGESCDPFGLVANDGDCDDSDPEIHPGAEDVPYDGIDSDCDGVNDFDQDRDGYPEGEDCDDADPAIHPDAAETLDDGIDSNCDGVDGTTWVAGGAGCACDATSSGGAGWGLVGVLGLVARRRRS